MKQSILLCSLLAIMLLGAFALAETPQWIQSTERLVGENSTQYEDTLNRAGKTIWNMYLVGHDPNGHHTIDPEEIGAVPQTTFDTYTSTAEVAPDKPS